MLPAVVYPILSNTGRRSTPERRKPGLSRRVASLHRAIQQGKKFVDQSDLRGLLDNEWSQTCNILSTNSTLESVCLPIHKIRRGGTKARRDIFHFVECNPSLTHVVVVSQEQEANFWIELVTAALSKSPSLAHVEFRRLDVKDPRANAFEPLKDLESLHTITTVNLDNATEEALWQAIQTFENVRHLRLLGATDSNGDTALPFLPYLCSLTVERHAFTEKALQSIADLVHTSASLRSLQIKVHECSPFALQDQASLNVQILEQLGSSHLHKLSLQKLNWEGVKYEDVKHLFHNANLESIALDGISEEMGRTIILQITPSTTLKTMSLALDWVSADMIIEADTYFECTPSVHQLNLSGPLVPTFTWTRPSGPRVRCSADISFASVDWDVLFAWIQAESSLPKEVEWTVKSMDKEDILYLGNLLADCQFLRRLNVFWSSRFSPTCATNFLTSVDQNQFVLDITIEDGLNPGEISNSTAAWLQKECRRIDNRNRVRSMIRSQSPASLWPYAFAKSHASFIFYALQQNALSANPTG